MHVDEKKIKERIEMLLKSDKSYSKDQRKDIVFHMTDWLSDFRALASFFENPEGLSSEAFEKILIGFLLHAPDHIAAARKIVTGQGMEDVFKVGIFEDA
jgi:hypothetical protein